MRMMKSVLAVAALLMPFSASAVEIDFNDYGFSSSGLASYDLSSFGPIARLELSNGANNWLQGVRTLSFDRTVAAPAPATLALLGLGLAAMGFRRR